MNGISISISGVGEEVEPEEMGLDKAKERWPWAGRTKRQVESVSSGASAGKEVWPEGKEFGRSWCNKAFRAP